MSSVFAAQAQARLELLVCRSGGFDRLQIANRVVWVMRESSFHMHKHARKKRSHRSCARQFACRPAKDATRTPNNTLTRRPAQQHPHRGLIPRLLSCPPSFLLLIRSPVARSRITRLLSSFQLTETQSPLHYAFHNSCACM